MNSRHKNLFTLSISEFYICSQNFSFRNLLEPHSSILYAFLGKGLFCCFMGVCVCVSESERERESSICDKIANRSNIRKCLFQLEGKVHLGGEGMAVGAELSGHIECAVRKQRCECCRLPCFLLFYLIWDSRLWGCCHPHVGVGLPTSAQEISSQTCPELCLLGDSRTF